MMRFARYGVAGALLALAAGAASAQDDDVACPHSLETVPASIRTILGPYYTGATPESGIGDASVELQSLMNEANVCRLIVMGPENASPTKQRDIMEWQSLNQWLTRLVNFTGLNSKGHTNVNWRDEYELFAEIYEMKI